MFCPQCGSTQNDELRFCKSCGANLQALRQIMGTRDADDKFDWSKTWVAEMFRSGEDAARQQAELDRIQGITPEVKRQNEIKAGVITASVGAALMLVLFVIMEGIIRGGGIADRAVEILSRIWIVGVLPLMIGFALIINGVFISKRRNENEDAKAKESNRQRYPDPVGLTETQRLHDTEAGGYLSPVDTNELVGTPLSVTDETTRHLKEPAKKKIGIDLKYRS